MKRIVLIYGLIIGAIITGNTLYMMSICCDNPNMETNDVLGYAAMIVVFSLVFFGIRNYRNKYSGGHISFGKAFKIGTLIVFVASTIYVVIGLSYYYLFVPEFLECYSVQVVNKAARSGASAAELAARKEQMLQLKEMYKNPVLVVLITYFEVFPVGLVVALVSALILKKK